MHRTKWTILSLTPTSIKFDRFLKLILVERQPLLACFGFVTRQKWLVSTKINLRKRLNLIDVGVESGPHSVDHTKWTALSSRLSGADPRPPPVGLGRSLLPSWPIPLPEVGQTCFTYPQPGSGFGPGWIRTRLDSDPGARPRAPLCLLPLRPHAAHSQGPTQAHPPSASGQERRFRLRSQSWRHEKGTGRR